LLESFARAIGEGDLDGVVALLARDAVLWADGGGHIRGAALRPVRGAEAVARFVIGVRQKIGGGEISARMVNGRLALVAAIEGFVQRIVSIDVRNGSIAGIYVIANPEKLRAAARSMQ
jgi:RNA polymerase sigma-70 factor, ECF subfamily